MSFLFSAVARLVILNRRVKRRDTTLEEPTEFVPSCQQHNPLDHSGDDLPVVVSEKSSASCLTYPQPKSRSESQPLTEDAIISFCSTEKGDTGTEEKEVNDDSDANSSSNHSSQPCSLSAARVTAINRALSGGRTTQVVYFGLGDNVLQFLQSPVAPPVTLYLVDDVSDIPSTPTSAKSKSSPALEYPLLPDDVRIVRVRTDLRDDAWDAHVVQAGYDWQQRSAWVVNLDISVSHFSSIHILDVFLRMVYNLTAPLSTVIFTYATEGHSGDETETKAKDQLRDGGSGKDNESLEFTPLSFSQFVRQRRFRVLCDYPIMGDEESNGIKKYSEGTERDDSICERVRIATLIHGTADNSTTTTSAPLKVSSDGLEEPQVSTAQEPSEESRNTTQIESSPRDCAKVESAPSSNVTDTAIAPALKDTESEAAVEAEEVVENEQDDHMSDHNPNSEAKTLIKVSPNESEDFEVVPDVQSEEALQTQDASDSGSKVEQEAESRAEVPIQSQSYDQPQAQADTQAHTEVQPEESPSEEEEDGLNYVVEFWLNTESLELNGIEDATDAIVVGSIAAIGEWQANNAIRMQGDLRNREASLKAKVNVTQDVQSFEYKYALVNNTGNIVRWEEGANRIIDTTRDEVESGVRQDRNDANKVFVRHESWRH